MREQLRRVLVRYCGRAGTVGVGGSVKGGVIEMQGDHRDVVVEILKTEGYTPVLARG